MVTFSPLLLQNNFEAGFKLPRKPNHSGFLKVSQQNRPTFELPRVNTYAERISAFYALFGQESPVTQESVEAITEEIDNIFKNLIKIAEEHITYQQQINPDQPPNLLQWRRLLYLRNRIVINPNMPANAGGYYDFQKVEGSNIPDIYAGEDYIALSPMCFFWNKDMLARVLVHELIHAGAHPEAESPITEESITDYAAAKLCEKLGYGEVTTGYKKLIEGIQQYLEGIPIEEVLRCIVCENGIINSRLSLKNLIKLIFLRQHVQALKLGYLNLGALQDRDLFIRIRNGIEGLRAYLPRIFNDIYEPEADLHAETTNRFTSENIANDLNIGEMLLEEVMKNTMWHDFAFKFVNYDEMLSANVRNEDELFVLFIQNLKSKGFYSLAQHIIQECRNIDSPVRDNISGWLANQMAMLNIFVAERKLKLQSMAEMQRVYETQDGIQGAVFERLLLVEA